MVSALTVQCAVNADMIQRIVRSRRIAEAQHGVVSRAQLSELGLGSDAIDHRIRVGRLCGIHRGVYAVVGRRLMTRRGFWMAAVLACGPGAVLSHRAAAALWGIRGGGRTEVTVPRGRRPRPGIRLHWANLPADEVTVHHGIPVTTIARTLFDLSAVVQRDELRSAFRQAEQLRLTDQLGLGPLIDRYPRKPGIPILRAVFEEAQRGLNFVRSEFEEHFQAFLLNAGLPRPLTNVRIEGIEVDCAWPKQRAHRRAGRPLPRTTRPQPSKRTAPGTAASRPRAGASSESPGGSCTTPPTSSRPTCAACSGSARSGHQRL